MLFNKNYDNDIIELNKKISEMIKLQNENNKNLIEIIKNNKEFTTDLMDKIQDSLLAVAKVQASHKEAIMLLSKR